MPRSIYASTGLPPPLKWAGGKRWLVPLLKEIWVDFSTFRLVEPFVGGMAVALGLQPKIALLNDSNEHLINLYRWLQRGLKITLPLSKDPETYYQYRKDFNSLVRGGHSGTQAAAELFYYLNRTCYNGLCRFNSKGEFNVPLGRYATINYRQDFSAYRDILAQWCFSVGDFASLELSPSDFVYADPPYDVEFTNYSPGGFSWQDQERLAHWLAKHVGPVVASNQATPRIVRLYEGLGFEVITRKAPRLISCTGNRVAVSEMIAAKGLGEALEKYATDY